MYCPSSWSSPNSHSLVLSMWGWCRPNAVLLRATRRKDCRILLTWNASFDVYMICCASFDVASLAVASLTAAAITHGASVNQCDSIQRVPTVSLGGAMFLAHARTDAVLLPASRNSACLIICLMSTNVSQRHTFELMPIALCHASCIVSCKLHRVMPNASLLKQRVLQATRHRTCMSN